jgi:hypothetical protein
VETLIKLILLLMFADIEEFVIIDSNFQEFDVSDGGQIIPIYCEAVMHSKPTVTLPFPLVWGL